MQARCLTIVDRYRGQLTRRRHFSFAGLPACAAAQRARPSRSDGLCSDASREDVDPALVRILAYSIVIRRDHKT